MMSRLPEDSPTGFPTPDSLVPLLDAADERCSQGQCSSASLHHRRSMSELPLPVSVVLPESYEPGYAYPLLVWFLDAGNPEEILNSLMPEISDRNFLGVAVHYRPGIALPGGQQPAEDREDHWYTFAQRMHETLCQLRRTYHIHSERLYIGGFGASATCALELFLRQPEWFRGAMLFNGQLPRMTRPLRNFAQLRQKRLFLSAATSPARLMHSAGLSVHVESPTEGADPSPTRLFSSLNHWLMTDISSATLV